MTTVKTAISLDKILLNEVNAFAKELHMSRSKFFADAAKEYIKQQKKKKLIDEINVFYAEGSDDEEMMILSTMKEKMANLLEPEEW